MPMSSSKLLAVLACCWAAPPLAAAVPEADVQEAVAALAAEDTCEPGEGFEECSLSLRQLRGQLQSVPVERHTAAAQTPEKQPQQASLVEVAGSEKEDGGQVPSYGGQPTYNYNWFFGNKGASQGVSQTTQQTQGANGQPVFNYNWHFNFDVDNKTVKKGNCRSFGCRTSFDMSKLTDACQCYPGCNESPFGNVCCPDYQQSCPSGGSKSAWGSQWGQSKHDDDDDYHTNGGYDKFKNAFCHNGHGGDEWDSELPIDEERCRTTCAKYPECKGYNVYRRYNMNICLQLKRIDLTKCERGRVGYTVAVKHSEMANAGHLPANNQGGGGRAGVSSAKGYITVQDRYCYDGHGGDNFGSRRTVAGADECRRVCTREQACEGFVSSGRICQLLSRVKLSECARHSGVVSGMKHGQRWSRRGRGRRHGGRGGAGGRGGGAAPGWSPSPSWGPTNAMPSYSPTAGMPGYSPTAGTPGYSPTMGMPGYSPTAGMPNVASMWPWMR